jgi:hypothetical protein
MARVRGSEDYWPGQRLEFGRLLDRQIGRFGDTARDNGQSQR